MNELEKLRKEIMDKYYAAHQAARAEYDRRSGIAMKDFNDAMDRAREIERQAGIGEEK